MGVTGVLVTGGDGMLVVCDGVELTGFGFGFGFGGAGLGFRPGSAALWLTAVICTCWGPWLLDAGWSCGAAVGAALFLVAAPMANAPPNARAAPTARAIRRRLVGRPECAPTGAKLLPVAVAPSTTPVLSNSDCLRDR